jgi:catechol 2,3-dioxygenase-like lactoylglutathione lyase family enzyme
VARRNVEKGIVHLRAGTSMLDLVALPEGAGRGENMHHVAFRIDPFDGAAIAAHLASHGVVCGPVVTRFGAEGSGPSVYLTDPDGNGVELKGPPAA